MTLGRKLGFSILPKHWVETVQFAGNLDSPELLDNLTDWGKVYITSDAQELFVVFAPLALTASRPLYYMLFYTIHIKYYIFYVYIFMYIV